MPEFQSLGPAGFAAVAAGVALVVYLALAVLVSGDAPRDVSIPAVAAAVGVGLGAFYARRRDTA